MVRFDERFPDVQTADMKDLDLVRSIQMAYPKIWFACHVEHRTRRQDRGKGLTDREAGLLAHISSGQHASSLAKHLGIGKAALSQHLKNLTSLGLITARYDPADRRQKIVELTDSCRSIVGESSVLDTERLRKLLEKIPEEKRDMAVAGLELLADAASRMRVDKENT